MEVMHKAVIPWSNVVEKLVQHYLEMKGPKYVTKAKNVCHFSSLPSIKNII